MRIAIVTDSTCDLPAEIIARYDLTVIPNILVIDGQSLEDGSGISREEFYNRLPTMSSLPTTATAASGAYSGHYERLLNRGFEHVLSIHPPTTLSGIANAANAAADAFDGRVTVIDSGQISLGLGLQVLATAKAVQETKPLEAVLELLAGLKKRTRVVAMLDTLEYIHRSGRVSWARARIGNLLRVKPFVEVKEGAVSSLGEVRTRQKGIVRLRTILDDMGPLEFLGILHTNAEADAQRFLAELEVDTSEPPLVVPVTTILGAHVGPNALGFAGIVR